MAIQNVMPPVTGQESSGKITNQTAREAQQNTVYQAPDPSRVQKFQNQNVYPDRQQQQYNLNSNYDRFLQALRNSPNMVDEFGNLIFSKMGNLVNAGIGQGFAEEIASFMKMLSMTESQLLAMLKGQQGQNLKFSGPFFDILRQIAQTNGPVDLKNAVLDFLRRYDSLTSGKHIFNNILSNLDTIQSRMPRSIADQLAALTSRLNPNLPNGQQHANLQVLKNDIMPFLSNYISQTRDFGAVRDAITMLTLNVARYDSGTFESMLQSLRTLTSYSQLTPYLGNISVEDLATRLAQQQNQADPLSQALVNIIARGLNGEAGAQNQLAFQNILHSMLLNQSVYMPLVHIMLPGELDGRNFFSEIWVDPNDEGNSGSDGGEGGRAVKLLIKFDIQNLGFFDMVMLVQDGKVDMELLHPPNFPVTGRKLRDDLAEILAKNNLQFRSVFIGKSDKPKSISEVFPKLYEGRNAVNVTV